MDTVNPQTLGRWRHHWQDEADAAFLYSRLAAGEADDRRKEIYRRLADVEQRHTGIWRQLLADHGVELPQPRPSLRARGLAWIGGRFGPDTLLSFLRREEGLEVKGYLALYRESPAGRPQDAALQLARESAEHAETLSALTKTPGEPWHRARSGGVIRNVIYGFNDGLTANFGLVAGVVGAAVEPHVILVTGIAGAVADALSMGSSGYLAAKSEQEVYAHEIAMEQDEMRLMPEVEEEELAVIYEGKGFGRERAQHLAREIMSSPRDALAEQVREELGIREPASTPLGEGVVTGSATAVGALIPVVPFLILEGPPAVWGSFVLAMLMHFAVGAARSLFTGRGVCRSGLDMFVVGLGVAAIGYLAGDLLVRWLL